MARGSNYMVRRSQVQLRHSEAASTVWEVQCLPGMNILNVLQVLWMLVSVIQVITDQYFEDKQKCRRQKERTLVYGVY